jgi:hypothetical protein
MVIAIFTRGCLVLLLLSTVACSSSIPTAPSSPETPTRIIALSGNLAFGNVPLGSQATATLTIANRGNSPLTVTRLTESSGFTASWTHGSIPAGGSQQVTIQFTPTAAQPYSAVLTVDADHTSGTNTMAMSGTGYEVPAGIYNWVFDPGKLESCTADSCQDFSGSVTNTGTGCATNVWFHVEFYTQESGNTVDILVPPVDSTPTSSLLRPGQPFSFQTSAVLNTAGRHIIASRITINYAFAACQ